MPTNLQNIILIYLLCVVSISCNYNSSKKTGNSTNYKPIIESLSNQGNWKEAIDIVNIKLKSFKTHKQNPYYYLVLGQNYRFLEKYDLSEDNFKKVIEDSKSIKNLEYLGEAYYGMGDLNYLNGVTLNKKKR